MAVIEILGVQYTDDDPCGIANALTLVRAQLAIGDGVRTVRFGQDEITYGSADRAALDREITRYTRLCETKNGTGKRTRFAKAMRYV